MKMEIPECYVCLQECEEKSPCQCEIPVHPQCLQQINKEFCTICKNPLSGTFYITIEEMEEEPMPEQKKCRSVCARGLCKYISLGIVSMIITFTSYGFYFNWVTLLVCTLVYIFLIVIVNTNMGIRR